MPLLAFFLAFPSSSNALPQGTLDRLHEVHASSVAPDGYRSFAEKVLFLLGPSVATIPRVSAMASRAQAASVEIIPQAAADSAFVFRDLYVFPNPARRNEKPTIRVQTGVADSVEIRIYDISGAVVHGVSLNTPQIIDDGNGKGPQYTYDYRWDYGDAGSGVYIAAVTARKGGQDIRKLKKFGLLR